MLIAQISDLHVAPDGSFMRQFVDSNELLARAVDVPQHDDAASRRRARDRRPHRPRHRRGVRHAARDPRRARGAVVPRAREPRRGRRAACRVRHAGVRVVDREFDYVVDDFPVRLVALDSTIAGSPRRRSSTPRSSRGLDATLAAAPDRPTLIFLHHPPFETGVWWMDCIGLTGRARARGDRPAAPAGATRRRRSRAPIGHQHVGHDDREHRAEHVSPDRRRAPPRLSARA